MSQIDYTQIGLKVGLEIHRQLNTRHKLFCSCPTELSEGKPTIRFERRLRPTQSELGQVDPAALFEFHKGRTILYEADPWNSCLVEMDEEPPGELNSEAIDVALIVSLLLGSDPVEEIHMMRKIVIDGSNTTGFQRTCVVALGGTIEVEGRRIPIQQISLEEDAARKTGESGMTVDYRIDRLGIPLIEISTGPVISSPNEVVAVAYTLGGILKATRKVKRGLGSIRQDLNISIRDGALIEVKGVQELDLLRSIVELEVKRQLALLRIRDELRARGVSGSDLKDEYVDLSDVFRETKCKIISTALAGGGVAKGVVLRGFGGLMGRELVPNLRLGTEMASRAMFWGRVGGIFHTDELPAYGISKEEVEAVRERLRATPLDAVVLVADSATSVHDALSAVVARAREAFEGVPDETRAAMPDGSTRYMRPRPGAARMYPETDVPPVSISDEKIRNIKSSLPQTQEALVRSLMAAHELNRKLATQLVDSDYLNVFERIAAKGKVAASYVVTILTEVLKSLEREGLPVERLSDRQLEDVFSIVGEGSIAKEAVEDVLRWLAQNPACSVSDAVGKLGLRMLSEKELEQIVSRVIEANRELIRARREEAFSKMVGLVMSEVRGMADAKVVNEKVKASIAQLLGEPA